MYKIHMHMFRLVKNTLAVGFVLTTSWLVSQKLILDTRGNIIRSPERTLQQCRQTTWRKSKIGR